MNGLRSEISENYFAQADDGGVYYMGEVVDVYDRTGAVVSHEGSWIVGGPALASDPPDAIDAPPGLRMPATPQVGDVFYSENSPPALYEKDTVTSVSATLRVPGGVVHGAIKVREDGLPGSGDPPEVKWWVPGIGVANGRTKGASFRLVATTFVAAK